MVCALTEYAVAVTSAAANNVVANFCMLISDFDARKTSVQESERNLSAVPSRSNIIVPPRACSRFGPAILHRSSASLYAQRNGYQGHEPATLEKMLDLLRSHLRPARRYIASPAAADDLLSCRAWNQYHGRPIMLGVVAGVIALLGMSAAVIVGASILYDPERSYHQE
jgi:hypothetical protein